MSAADEYMRVRALRVLNDDSGAYPMIARDLAIGVLDLLDQRARGRAITSETHQAEMAELRDGLATVAAKSASIGAHRQLAACVALLEQRVNGLAARHDSLAAKVDTL